MSLYFKVCSTLLKPSEKHVKVSQCVFVWCSTCVCAVFQLVEASKQAGEKQLLEKKEKLMLELQKIKDRVDEFNDYGELDMMQQYVQVWSSVGASQ